MKLLNNLHVFNDMYGNPLNPAMVPYINCLESFQKVRLTCFVKKVLDQEEIELCHQAMDKFKYDCKIVISDFDIHAIHSIYNCIVHVPKWIDHFKIGLGFVMEQTGESLHEDYDSFVKNKAMISKIDSHKYLESLKKNTVAFMSEKCRRQPK